MDLAISSSGLDVEAPAFSRFNDNWLDDDFLFKAAQFWIKNENIGMQLVKHEFSYSQWI